MVNNKHLNKFIMTLILTTTILCNVCWSAVVTDSDDKAFVTKSEFEAIKTNILGQLEAYNNNLDNAIDQAISDYIISINDDLISDDFYDKIYPVGVVVVSPVHPAVGQWKEIKGDISRTLWLQQGNSWGSTLEQHIPIPLCNVSDETAPNHTFTGTKTQTEEGGEHVHNCNQPIESSLVGPGTPTKSALIYGSATSKFPGTSVAGKAHSFTPEGNISTEEHTHTLPAIVSPEIYLQGSEWMQPDLYYIKMWQRIA